MLSADFEAGGIEYRLILAAHGIDLDLFFGSKKLLNTTVGRKRIDLPLDGLDALVIETGYQDRRYLARCLSKNSFLADSMEELRERKIPIYSVDAVGKNYYADISLYFSHYGIHALMAYATLKLAGLDNNIALYAGLFTAVMEAFISAYADFPSQRAHRFSAKISSLMSLARQAPVEELRNALAARKIKKGVVPHLLDRHPKRFADRPPRIGIVYGSAHTGIKECLESDSRTDFTLWLHRHYGLRLMNPDGLRDIYVYRITRHDRTAYYRFQVDIS